MFSKLKWNNRGLWVALGALVTMILNDAFDFTPGTVELYVDAFLVLLTAAGVISNPVDGKWFADPSVDKTTKEAERNERRGL